MSYCIKHDLHTWISHLLCSWGKGWCTVGVLGFPSLTARGASRAPLGSGGLNYLWQRVIVSTVILIWLRPEMSFTGEILSEGSVAKWKHDTVQLWDGMATHWCDLMRQRCDEVEYLVNQENPSGYKHLCVCRGSSPFVIWQGQQHEENNGE